MGRLPELDLRERTAPGQEELKMPRAFLVKKPCVSTCKRNWSELPDEERGEIYVPGEAPRAPGPGRAGRTDQRSAPVSRAWGRRFSPWIDPRRRRGARVGEGDSKPRLCRSQARDLLPAPRYRGRSGVCHRSGDLRLSRRKSRKPGLS